VEAYSYARDVIQLDFCSVLDHAFGCMVKGHWDQVQKACRDFYEEGSFVPILGYEIMTGPRPGKPGRGHRNLYFRRDEAELLFGDYQPGSGGSFPGEDVPVYNKVWDTSVRRFRTLEALTAEMDPEESLVISHHTGSWDWHDPKLQRLVEVCSEWGISEPHPVQNLSAVDFREGLQAGRRLGFVGGSDDHFGRPGSWAEQVKDGPIQNPSGLTAAIAPECSREAIWDALVNRRTYATTGARILLGVKYQGEQAMGQEFTANGPVKFEVEVHGTSLIKRVELWKNGERHRPAEEYGSELSWHGVLTDEEPEPPAFYYVRVIQRDGHIAWGSPTWIDPAE
jgi:hypothetical protein